MIWNTAYNDQHFLIESSEMADFEGNQNSKIYNKNNNLYRTFQSLDFCI